LNVHSINDDKQTENHISEQLESEPSSFEADTAIEKLKSY